MIHAPLKIWTVSVLFVLFQFFLQLSSGVVLGAIMHDMHFTALTIGALSAAFYIVYTSLQIPVGVLFDCKNPRIILSSTSLLCGIGCFVFASSTSVLGLFLGRIIIGIGSAFAFVGLSHQLREHFPARQFSFMIGMSETIGLLATVVGIISLGAIITECGWREFIKGAGWMGFMISFLSWLNIPSQPASKTPMNHYWQQIISILGNKKLWINGAFIGLTFSIVTIFGAMWASPFIQLKLNCNIKEASFITALFFLGTAISCPLFGWLGTRLSRRKPLIFTSALLTTILFCILVYCPIQHPVYIGSLMFLVGLCCGSYILTFPIANELAPIGSLSTCTGFINTLALVTTPIVQPLVGFLLDLCSENKGIYTLANYQVALLVIPGSLLIACVLACHLPEKSQGSVTH